MVSFRTLFPFSSANAQSFAFPQPGTPHLATVKDRVRNSGLTSVRFVKDNTCIAADFASKKCYLVDISGSSMKILDMHETVIADGTAVETDLIDYADGKFIVSNFYQGTFSLFEINDDRICFVREVETGDITNLHGLRFVPGYDNLIWLTFCNYKKPCHRILDVATGKILHTFETDQQCQDVAFSGEFAVVFARTNHISKGEAKVGPDSPKNIIFATAYIYRLPANLNTDPPERVSQWRGKGHVDACKEAPDGRIFSANQYLDRVDIFKPEPDGKLKLTGTIKGFNMPHGLDIRNNRLAVTNYGDQTLRVMMLPS